MKDARVDKIAGNLFYTRGSWELDAFETYTKDYYLSQQDLEQILAKMKELNS